MRFLDVITFKPSFWQKLHYQKLELKFVRSVPYYRGTDSVHFPVGVHHAEIDIDATINLWERFKFCLWLFRSLGGKK